MLYARRSARRISPYPFQIIQSQKDILFAYEYATTNRLINMGKPQEPATDTWMGTSNGHWEKDTLVVDVTGFNGNAWFDRAGDFASDSLHVVERYRLLDANTMDYEATIEDPATFTRPWKINLICTGIARKTQDCSSLSAWSLPSSCCMAIWSGSPNKRK